MAVCVVDLVNEEVLGAFAKQIVYISSMPYRKLMLRKTICSLLAAATLASCTGVKVNLEKETLHFETIYGFSAVDREKDKSFQYLNIAGMEMCRVVEGHFRKHKESIDFNCNGTVELSSTKINGSWFSWTRFWFQMTEGEQKRSNAILEYEYSNKENEIEAWKRKHNPFYRLLKKSQ